MSNTSCHAVVQSGVPAGNIPRLHGHPDMLMADCGRGWKSLARSGCCYSSPRPALPRPEWHTDGGIFLHSRSHAVTLTVERVFRLETPYIG